MAGTKTFKLPNRVECSETRGGGDGADEGCGVGCAVVGANVTGASSAITNGGGGGGSATVTVGCMTRDPL